jgi:hypothetical protein
VCAEALKREKDTVLRRKLRAEKKARRAALEAAAASGESLKAKGPPEAIEEIPSAVTIVPAAVPALPVKSTPVAFLFPGQGSQAVGMLKVSAAGPTVSSSNMHRLYGGPHLTFL